MERLVPYGAGRAVRAPGASMRKGRRVCPAAGRDKGGGGMKILAADLGGTHSRFALFKKDGRSIELSALCELPSDFGSFRGLLGELFRQWKGPGIEDSDVFSVAAAGPLREGRIRMTHAPFTVCREDAGAFFPGARFIVMNDFEAQAWACHSPVSGSFECLLAGRAHAGRGAEGKRVVTAVVGAGTGLGAAWIMRGPGNGELFAAASEAGHMPFPFFGKEESAIAEFLRSRLGKEMLCAEDVLSGGGLALLHEYCVGRWSDPGLFTAEEDFSASPCCAFFARFYGRFCRSAALFLLPSRLAVSGGVAGRTPALVRHPEFAGAFLEGRGAEHDWLEEIPVLLNRHPQSGLWGAAWAAFDRKEEE